MKISLKHYFNTYGLIVSLRCSVHFLFRFIRSYYPKRNPILVNDLLMNVFPNDPGISKELSIFKIHEPINTKLISNLIKKNMTCIDIGGNIGYYAMLESKLVGEKGLVIVFEPVKKNYELFEKNIKLNNIQNIISYNVACGNEEITTRFFENVKSNGGKVLLDSEPIPLTSGTIKNVKVVIGDKIISQLELSHIDFIRMDAEGYELKIIQGLEKTIRKFRPIISLELHKRQLGIIGTKEFLLFFKSLGYHIDSYIPRDLDIPFIGTINDVEKFTIDKFLNLLENDKIPSFVMINLVNFKNQYRPILDRKN